MDKQKMKTRFSKGIWSIFRFVLIFGLCFIILYPFLVKILAAFMSPTDLLDSTVKFIPRNWSTYYWKFAWERLDILKSGGLSLLISVVSACLQVIVSTMVGYGLARFNFKGKKIAFEAGDLAALLHPCHRTDHQRQAGDPCKRRATFREW